MASVDTAWLLVCAVLVLLMQAGFTALESGVVRSKNSANVAIKNFANFLVAASLFWLFGFGLMFGRDAAGFGGGSLFLFDSGDAHLNAFFLFQLGFIGTATTLMSGAVAERMRFAGYLVLVVVVAAIVYPLFGHWAWGDGGRVGGASDGWLRDVGFLDFAGSTVVHSTGGWSALAAIIVIGPRLGRFGEGAAPIHGHDLPFTTLGVFVLWVGWYGFNGGSTFALTDSVPAIIRNTTLAATFGGLAGMALTWGRDRRPDVVTIMNGSLGGLVAITAAANVVSAFEAAVIGAIGALVMHTVSVVLERRRIDDAVGAVPVHLGAGIWGTLAVALFGNVDAFTATSGRLEQFGIQLLGVAVCCVWSFGLVWIALTLINRRFPLRIHREGELAGLNIAEHGATTEIADLLADIDAQRCIGDFDRPVRVEQHTEVGQIAAAYNHVLSEIGMRTASLQLLQRTAAAANEASSIEDALAAAIGEICHHARWPIGHAYLISREDPEALVPSVWHFADEARHGTFRAVSDALPRRIGHGLPGVAVQTRQPVFVSADDLPSSPAESIRVTVVSLEPLAESTRQSLLMPLIGTRGELADTLIALGLRSGLAVPIMAGHEAVGALEFALDAPFTVDEELLELVMSIGTQLGRVVERERSEEARLRTVIDNMPASVYLRDLDGRFLLVNREYEEFWGVSSDEIRGKTLAEVDGQSDVPMSVDLNAEIDRATLRHGEAQRREARVVRHGKEHVLSDVRFPVYDSAANVVAIAGIDIDITEPKRNQAEMAELLARVETARDAAMDAAAAKSRFLANVSHELRTPLNAIIGFTRLVSRNSDGLPGKQVDNLSKILTSARQLLGLIDEILDLSKIDAAGIDVMLDEVDVAALVQQVADTLEPLVEPSRVRLRVDVDPRLPPVVTDGEKMHHILMNLISNAIKYTDRGSIEVRAKVIDGRLQVDVADTGIGIALDEQPRIFEEFHRADSPGARARRGTGLGLTISRRLARALGGDVSVQSSFGVGSTFTLGLPLALARANAAPTAGAT